MADRLAIVGGKVVTPSAVIENGIVLCEDGKITFVGSGKEAAPESGSQIVDAAGGVVMPGFIDTHFHGSGGDDVMANGAEGIRRISRALMKFGTTGFLATTIAARHSELMKTTPNLNASIFARQMVGLKTKSGAIIRFSILPFPITNLTACGKNHLKNTNRMLIWDSMNG